MNQGTRQDYDCQADPQFILFRIHFQEPTTLSQVTISNLKREWDARDEGMIERGFGLKLQPFRGAKLVGWHAGEGNGEIFQAYTIKAPIQPFLRQVNRCTGEIARWALYLLA